MTPLRHLHLPTTFRCAELRDRRILVTGAKLVKVYCLETYLELKSIPSEDYNWDALMTPDERWVFIATDNGLKQFSYPDFALFKVHEPSSSVHSLFCLRSKDLLLFNDKSRLLSLDLATAIIAEFDHRHERNIFSVVSTSDEQLAFSTGWDRKLKKWSTNSLAGLGSAELESEGRSLLLGADPGTVLVGLANGSLTEYSVDRLERLRTLPAHPKWISKVIRLSSGDVATCCLDGSLCLPFRNATPMKVPAKEIFSIAELSDGTLACCCDQDGLIVIPLSFLGLPPAERHKATSSAIDSISPTLDSISSSLKSIRASASPQKPQLVSLLQHHLAQLLSPVRPQAEKFTGLALSLLPDLRSIQRSHRFEGASDGRRKRLLTQRYSLETPGSGAALAAPQAILTLFDRRLKLFGRAGADAADPLAGFKVEQMRRGKWVFSMTDQTGVSGPARVNFINGYLDCYTSEGFLTDRSGFQSTLKVGEVVKAVLSVANDGTVLTADRRLYKLNLETAAIEDPLKR